MVESDTLRQNVPSDLKKIDHWIGWREDTRNGKVTKIPTKAYATRGDPNAAVNDPNVFRDFETAVTALDDTRVTVDGLGFVFTDDVTITGVDLDKCRDSETGELEEWAEDIIDRLDSYTEVSPSGTGVHILVGGTLPPGGNRKGNVEMYDSDRYFTMTGDHLEGTPAEIQKCQEELADVHCDYIRGGIDSDGQTDLGSVADTDTSDSGGDSGRHNTSRGARQTSGTLRDRYGDAYSNIRESAIREALERVGTKYLPRECPSTFDDLAGPGVDLSDEELLERMFSSKGGEKKERLFRGDASMWGSHEAEYPSQSEADMAFAHTLAFWTGKDPERMDALFRESGLYREKWNSSHYASGATYGAVTLARALLRVEDYYETPSEMQNRGSSQRQSSSSVEHEDPGRHFGKPGGVGVQDDDLVETVDLAASSDTPSSPTVGESAQDAAGGASATHDGSGGAESSAGAPSASPSLHTDDGEESPEPPAGDRGPTFDEPDVVTSFADASDAVATASSDTPNDVTGNGQADVAAENEADAADVGAESTVRGDDATETTPEAVDDANATAGTTVGDDATAPGSEPASPRGVSTDETLRDSTQRAMAETAEQAGPEWERTNPYQEDDEKHPNDWTVQQGQPVTEQVISMAREDNCILARKLRRQGEHLRDLREERDTYEFTAEVYLNALDELMGERNRYRAALRERDLLTEEEDALPDDGGKRLQQIIEPMLREDEQSEEDLGGLDALLAQYTAENDRRQRLDEEQTRRGGLRGALSRLVSGD